MAEYFVGSVKLSLVSRYSQERENHIAIVEGADLCRLLLLIKIEMTFCDDPLDGSILVVYMANEFDLILGSGEVIGEE